MRKWWRSDSIRYNYESDMDRLLKQPATSFSETQRYEAKRALEVARLRDNPEARIKQGLFAERY